MTDQPDDYAGTEAGQDSDLSPTETIALVRRIQSSSENRCFACGPSNPIGLHLHFDRIDGGVRALFTPSADHHGWQHAVHGGIVATLLDEAMAYTLFFAGVQGVTARMEIRYRRPVRSGETLTVEARLIRETRKLADVEGRVVRDGEVIAEAAGRFFKAGTLRELVETASDTVDGETPE